jgi:hypothetical protein
MAAKMENVMRQIGIEKFGAIVTDNASVMVKASAILEKNSVTLLFSAHALRLIIGDITKLKSVEDAADTCKSIVKGINKSQILRANFADPQKEIGQTCSLKIPAPTRWGSILQCLYSLLKSKNVWKRLAIHEEMNLSKLLRSSILHEDMFWMYVQKLQELIHPNVKSIFLLESDKAKISTVPQCFKELNDHFTKCLAGSLLTEKERQDVTKSHNKRKDMALKDIDYAAHILDPKFNGECLSRSEQIQGT